MSVPMKSDDPARWPRTIEAYETSDGEIHRSKTYADGRQQQIDGAKLATDLLKGGANLGEALRRGGFLPDGVYPELDEVLGSTKLVIEHWQCQSKPGYQPYEVTKDGAVFVYGDAGAWSGPYGSDVSIPDVARYWRDTKKRMGLSESKP